MDESWQAQEEQTSDPLVDGKGVLFRRTVRGGYWVLAIQVVTQLLALGKMILLARLLIKVDMGVLGIALLATQTLQTFSATGFRTALIHDRKDIRPYLDTAWTLHAIRGIFLAALLFAAAPVLASMKVPPDKMDTALGVIRAMACVFLLGGLQNIGPVYFTKELDFRSVFIYRVASTLVDIIVSIVLLLLLRSVWAYVWGRLAAGGVHLLLSYVMHPYRPRFTIDWHRARTMWQYGRWITLMTVLVFLVNSGDDYFVWAYLGVSALAVYQMAYRFSNVPAVQVAAILAEVSFPAFAKLQTDIPRLRQAYLKTLFLAALLSLPLAGGIIGLAPEFVRLFLTEKWSAVSPVLQILTIKAALRASGVIRSSLFQAAGKPHIMTRMQVARVVWLAALIYPLTVKAGLVGTAWAITISGLAVLPFELRHVARILGCSIGRSVQPLVIPLVSTGVMMAVIVAVRAPLHGGVYFRGFFGMILVAMITYTGSVYLLDRWFGRHVRTLLTEQLKLLAAIVRDKWSNRTGKSSDVS